MAKLRRSSDFYVQLCKLIEIPPEWRVRRLVLTFAVDSIPTIVVEMDSQAGTGEPVTKRYRLEEIPQEPILLPDPEAQSALIKEKVFGIRRW